LPTTAAVGDAIEISATTSNASYELLLSTGSGQTCALGGTVVAASTEITRLLMAGESMLFVYEASNVWKAYDGRIPQRGIVRVTTAGTTNTGASLTSPSAMGSYAGTADLAIGCTVSTANFTITSRRAGKCDLQFFWLSNGSVGSGLEVLVNLIRNSSVSVTQFRIYTGAAGLVGLSGSGSVNGVVDEVFGMQIRTTGTNNSGCAVATFMAMTEVL